HGGDLLVGGLVQLERLRESIEPFHASVLLRAPHRWADAILATLSSAAALQVPGSFACARHRSADLLSIPGHAGADPLREQARLHPHRRPRDPRRAPTSRDL